MVRVGGCDPGEIVGVPLPDRVALVHVPVGVRVCRD